MNFPSLEFTVDNVGDSCIEPPFDKVKHLVTTGLVVNISKSPISLHSKQTLSTAALV